MAQFGPFEFEDPGVSPDPPPSPRVQPDEQFNSRLRDLRRHAREFAEAELSGGQTKWFRPEDMPPPERYETIVDTLFNRSQVNTQMGEAMQDPDSPGTSSDMVGGTAQIDFFAVMARAVLARHCHGPCRVPAHAAARYRGHGDTNGPVNQNFGEYVLSVLREGQGGGK